MRSLTRTGPLLALVLLCAAAAPREASAEHRAPYIQLGATRDGGFHLRLGHAYIAHPRGVASGEHRRGHRLVAQRERLSHAALHALRAGELGRARRLFLRATRVEGRRRGRPHGHDGRSEDLAHWR